jgi:hypothetical protein
VRIFEFLAGEMYPRAWRDFLEVVRTLQGRPIRPSPDNQGYRNGFIGAGSFQTLRFRCGGRSLPAK